MKPYDKQFNETVAFLVVNTRLEYSSAQELVFLAMNVGFTDQDIEDTKFAFRAALEVSYYCGAPHTWKPELRKAFNEYPLITQLYAQQGWIE